MRLSAAMILVSLSTLLAHESLEAQRRRRLVAELDGVEIDEHRPDGFLSTS